jgi:hypothetical protein
MNNLRLPKCQVANCENDASCICIESKLRYCAKHKHSHRMDEEHVHNFGRLPEYWNTIIKKGKK